MGTLDAISESFNSWLSAEAGILKGVQVTAWVQWYYWKVADHKCHEYLAENQLRTGTGEQQILVVHATQVNWIHIATCHKQVLLITISFKRDPKQRQKLVCEQIKYASG